MSEKRGCFKTGLLGCLAIFVIGFLIIAVTGLMAWKRSGDQQIEDTERTPAMARVDGGEATMQAPVLAGAGKVFLELKQGEFEIRPADPGAGVSVQAKYDAEVFELLDSFEAGPDSTWVYRVRFNRTVSGLHLLFRQLMGAGHDSRVRVYLPQDLPIELHVMMEEGGFTADLGGMWLTDVDIEANKGGMEIAFNDPLHEPVDRMRIKGSMGGLAVEGVGNASPRVLDIGWRMGGGALELDGEWVRDCDARLSISMGGMAVFIPEELRVEGASLEQYGLQQPDDAEIPTPVLRLTVSEKMGEIEIEH